LMTGGPMMGNLIGDDIDIPITKTLSGILVLPPDIPPVKERQKSIAEIIREAKIACCNCSYCTELCPRYAIGHDFKTHLIMQGVAFASPEFYVEYDASFMCCECGICSMVACPMGLSPRMINQFMKEQISKAGIRPKKKEKILEPSLNDRKVPYSRLLRQIGLTDYDVFPPFFKDKLNVSSVRIPLSQHIGAPQSVAVKVGDQVIKGQKLTIEEDIKRMSVPVHSSINGVVTAIKNSEICIEERK
ncbi:4Fe-4S dicluster domain-containing protein, partial [bacterium]|nr:4Fe-4S dicluster domain-containing protein [bacterium]